MNKIFFKASPLLMAFSLTFIGDTLAQKKKNKKDNEQAMVSTRDANFSDSLLNPVPTQRQLFTTRIQDVINQIDRRDGHLDQIVKFRDDQSTSIVTQALIHEARSLMYMVENMDIDHPTKIRYHRIVESSLKQINIMPWVEMRARDFQERIRALRSMIQHDHTGTLTDYVRANSNLVTLDYIENFDDVKAKTALYSAMSKRYPERLVHKLPQILNEPYADNIVASAAQVMPATILSYAQSSSQLSALVRRNQDPLVKTIVQIADNSRNTLKVLPFLGAINRGEKTIKELDAIANDDDKYLQALVDLIVANEQLGRADIEKELNIRTMNYVREINALHNASDAVRFKSIQGFRDVDYYVMMLGGQDEIYTSSFTRGPFALMIQKMGKKSGNELLDQLHYYNFRTFIRIAAGFGRLSNFLATMEQPEKVKLMQHFVDNLEAGEEDDLTAAVDVADAYGSLKDTVIVNFLKDEIVKNYERVKSKNHEKGIVVYGLLASIFNNNRSDSDLPIPPITYLPTADITMGNPEIVEQMFFYGDSDGKAAYGMFLNSVRSDKRFKIDDKNKYWTVITSSNSKNKLTIYANKPLTEPEDETAQRALKAYMDENDIVPTVIVHRGHSYFVPTTLEHITPDVKVVMLGSCGGYHNLSRILNTATDAHIISSKQMGTGVVNETILKQLHNELMTKDEINWVTMWQNLDKDFARLRASDREYFSDYVPPNKNLGAIFIKAYRSVMEAM